jgi:hypothetical protein
VNYHHCDGLLAQLDKDYIFTSMLESLLLFRPSASSFDKKFNSASSAARPSGAIADDDKQIMVALDILWELSTDVAASESTRRFLSDSGLVKKTHTHYLAYSI